jgi:hypothetical protein
LLAAADRWLNKLLAEGDQARGDAEARAAADGTKPDVARRK